MRPALCPVLVGRDDEARQLRDALVQARAGRGSTVLLAGEAGIGKSRLAREIIESAREQECPVLVGRAVAGGVPTPFRPFAEALASALRPGGAPESAELDPFRPALARLVPHLRDKPAATTTESPQSLVFLGEAVLRLLRVLYPRSGCLLLLEDLHWGDPETLALLEYLADNVWAERVLCLGTFRPGEGGEVVDMATKLEARGAARVLSLGRLGADAMARMALECLGAAGLPAAAQNFVAERAEGIPFLVEEVLAGLLEEGTLVERDGRWQATTPITAGVPATFADSVVRRLDAFDQDGRRVIRAAAVIGRQFEWSLLRPIASVDDDLVLAALRKGVDSQLIATGEDGFWFRHALTQEAVLAGLLPPERARLAGLALLAVEAAHPGLPGAWCMLAADLAERAGQAGRASELLLELGKRDLAVGALVSAEQTLTRAKTVPGGGGAASAVFGRGAATGRGAAAGGGAALELAIDEALTEVFAVSGQVDRAIEMGQRLLARIGTSSAARSADLHLLIAQAAIAGGRWAEADASLEIARRLPHPQLARVDACAAQLAERQGRPDDATRLASSALHAAEAAALPEVACEALEVIGRVLQHSDLDEAERALSRAAAIASANNLQLWHARALTDLGGIDMLRSDSLDRLTQARELATAQGALFLTAVIDLQVSAGLIKRFRADEALATIAACVDASRRFRLMALPEALVFQASALAILGRRDEMEACLAQACELAPDDPHILASAWGRCRATLSMLDEDLDQAWVHLDTGAELLLVPFGPAAPFLGLWALLGALLGKEVGAVGRVRAAHLARHGVIAGLLGYADAILAGRDGRPDAAQAAIAVADAHLAPLDWYRHYARRIAAEAALADGWGDPVIWLREAATYFDARDDDRIAAGCRRLLRQAGAPVPRPRPEDVGLPDRLRARGITGREADVLELVAGGLTNREIAERMFLSPRTVEKHVASLLAKTGLRRRSQLAAYLAEADRAARPLRRPGAARVGRTVSGRLRADSYCTYASGAVPGACRTGRRDRPPSGRLGGRAGRPRRHRAAGWRRRPR
jgi:DNA-binding CsgD family transcriptional regulator/tetratricopeptide (TPR) repeat protein